MTKDDQVLTPSEHGSSAIAQERDVGEPVAWLRWNSYFHASPHGQDAEGTEALELCEPVDRNAFPVYRQPTTSPKAIGEAPCADAVKTSPEVGEMVERLTTWANDDVRETARDGSIEPNDIEVWARMMEEAASLLIALDAEIARLREALKFYADVSKYPAPLTGGMGDLWSDCGNVARSALPASDEGTNNE